MDGESIDEIAYTAIEHYELTKQFWASPDRLFGRRMAARNQSDAREPRRLSKLTERSNSTADADLRHLSKRFGP